MGDYDAPLWTVDSSAAAQAPSSVAMSMHLSQIVDFLATQGMPCELCGDGDVKIQAVNTLEDARPGEISFLANPKYERQLKTTTAPATS